MISISITFIIVTIAAIIVITIVITIINITSPDRHYHHDHHHHSHRHHCRHHHCRNLQPHRHCHRHCFHYLLSLTILTSVPVYVQPWRKLRSSGRCMWSELLNSHTFLSFIGGPMLTDTHSLSITHRC